MPTPEHSILLRYWIRAVFGGLHDAKCFPTISFDCYSLSRFVRCPGQVIPEGQAARVSVHSGCALLGTRPEKCHVSGVLQFVHLYKGHKSYSTTMLWRLNRVCVYQASHICKRFSVSGFLAVLLRFFACKIKKSRKSVGIEVVIW